MKKLLLLLALVGLLAGAESCKSSKKAQKNVPQQKVKGKVAKWDGSKK